MVIMDMHEFTCQSDIAKWDGVNIWSADTFYKYITNLMYMGRGEVKRKRERKQRERGKGRKKRA